MEMVLVDEGSEDGSVGKLEEYHGEEAMIVHTSRRNFGKGAAIRTGISYATGNILLVQDADLEYDPNDYPALLKPIIGQDVPVVSRSWFP